jgi:6-pyruvoyltetrahydropterin/6-carboxytetrahydropterin synthase
MQLPRFTVRVEAGFEAAHALREYRGAAEPLHGHSWRVVVTAGSDRLDPDGLAVDFVVLQNAVSELLARFRHRNLNDVEPFDRLNPSAENLAVWVAERLNQAQVTGAGRLVSVEVWEGPACAATYWLPSKGLDRS